MVILQLAMFDETVLMALDSRRHGKSSMSHSGKNISGTFGLVDENQNVKLCCFFGVVFWVLAPVRSLRV